MNMFEQATQMKLRFETTKCLMSVEDLWDLPLQSCQGSNRNPVSLDDLAIASHRKIQSMQEESFVATSSVDTTEQLRLDILKHIISVKMGEQKAQQEAADKRQKRQEIDALIAQKKQNQMAEMPLEDLLKMREELS